MAITTLNLRALNRSDTATSGQVITATSATAADFQDAAGGAWNLIKTITASADSTISFVNGAADVVLDSTYDEYCFKYISLHPATDATEIQFQGSIDGGSNYNVAITSTAFQGYNNEAGSSANVAYYTADDLAQGTGFQNLCNNVGNANDECVSGTLYLFNPSSTTFIKNWINRSQSYSGGDLALDGHQAGYFNTTSAINAIQFKMTGGNIDAGKIKLYGIS